MSRYDELSPEDMIFHAIQCVARGEKIPVAIQSSLDRGTIEAIQAPGDLFNAD